MPLLSLWSSNPTAIGQFTIEQVVAAAGDGNLRDGSDCSLEIREYLSQVSSTKLAQYVDRCLSAHFPKGGMVLQDLVNELGRRLEYQVTNGRYQGTVNAIGYDGIWTSPEGHTIVLEVKTTDVYRISPDNIAKYREKLLAGGKISVPSSILIVVGREDTGELEAQVRGSRHAWDVRLISADALIKLVELKEAAEGPETGRKIRSLLAPMEYTRLDEMIDVMFTTAKDMETAVGAETGGEAEPTEPTGERATKGPQFTDNVVLQAKRESIVTALGRRERASLIRKSRALYWDATHQIRAAVTISKCYARKGNVSYWYAYHPQWDEFLGEGEKGYFVLGCVDLNAAFAIPLNTIRPLLDSLNVTERDSGERYWHIYLAEDPKGEITLIIPREKRGLPLSEFALRTEQA